MEASGSSEVGEPNRRSLQSARIQGCVASASVSETGQTVERGTGALVLPEPVTDAHPPRLLDSLPRLVFLLTLDVDALSRCLGRLEALFEDLGFFASDSTERRSDSAV